MQYVLEVGGRLHGPYRDAEAAARGAEEDFSVLAHWSIRPLNPRRSLALSDDSDDPEENVPATAAATAPWPKEGVED